MNRFLKINNKESGRIGCFHLILLLAIVVLCVGAYYGMSNRIYGSEDRTKIRELAGKMCNYELPATFSPVSGANFVILRYAVFNYEENGNEKAKFFLLSTSLIDEARDLVYEKLREKFSGEKLKIKESSTLEPVLYGTNTINMSENVLAFNGTNQTATAFEVRFNDPQNKVVAWIAAFDNKVARDFIESVKPADEKVLEHNKKEREIISTIGWALFWIGIIVIFFGYIFMLIAGFQESIWWALSLLFLPFVLLFFLIYHWRKAAGPFQAMVFGLALYIIGIILIFLV